ncbi:MAG: tRNA (adenosine(37)-N6)-threonylcarbamoyltransferase complex ATPase subunit type 1 TsaE [Elusimicrobia bacterium]|nr:tRNA (adenosine(37)-N6)-threonylcarbamoyltransferase complex ATPase subunit type 1 TsaE [Elusimicrobiota bacterium]
MKGHFLTATESPEQTKRLGMRLARRLKVGDVVLLLADLGAGKTTLVQGLADGVGAHGTALSPTFVVAETIAGRVPIHHLDFYRLSLREILSLGVEDYLNGAGEIGPGIVVAEWAERFKPLWPKERLEIRIRIDKRGERRRFEFKGVGPRYQKIVDAIARAA